MRPTGGTTADYALIASLLSLAVAIVSLLWNIRAKFLHPTPKLSVRLIVNSGLWREMGIDHIAEMAVVNLGPTDCGVHSVLFTASRKSVFSSKMS
ncbi:hypothetical protein BV509_15635 [Rhodovulum sulfidophilum]|nr:hypothetical protein BV509_15635 [Rhodovulum sulfidophilum]